MVRKSNINKTDIKIIEILKENSRIKNTELARRLGISEAAVRKRMGKLESLKIIKRYTIEIDYKKLGLIVSLTGIDAKPERLLKIIKELKKIKNIERLWLTSGDHMIMAKIIANSTEELSKIHSEIEEIDGVKRICPAIVLDEL